MVQKVLNTIKYSEWLEYVIRNNKSAKIIIKFYFWANKKCIHSKIDKLLRIILFISLYPKRYKILLQAKHDAI